MQVFISYARTPADKRLAEHIAERLRKAGIRPWLDDESMPGGQQLERALAAGIASSDHVVFLLSQSWIARSYTHFELNEVTKRDESAVRRIPVYRAKRDSLLVPGELVKWLGFDWFDEDPEPDARFWQLFCAIQGDPPGPRDAWSKRGYEVAPVPQPELPRPERKAFRPSLRCNRAYQWASLDTLARDPESHLVIVAGTDGNGHEHFLQRIEHELRGDPRRSIVPVEWLERPSSREEFLACLADALSVQPAAVASALSSRLAHSNVILLHPPIRARFADKQLMDYHTRWLPELAGRTGQMSLKSVQPIEWPPAYAIDQVLRWLGWRTAGPAADRSDAEELMRLLSAPNQIGLRVVRLRDLEVITTKDLEEFCALVGLDQKKSSWLCAQIVRRRPRTAEQTFDAIDAYLPEARKLS
jgi:hypothetical protein